MGRRVETQFAKMDTRFDRLEQSVDRWLFKILGLVSYLHYSYFTKFSKGIWLQLIWCGVVGVWFANSLGPLKTRAKNSLTLEAGGKGNSEAPLPPPNGPGGAEAGPVGRGFEVM